MRPALLRLLKRPSSLSLLDSLTASPVGIEQLESKYTRLRCQSRCARLQLPIEDDESPTTQSEFSSNPAERKSREYPGFSIYEIEPPKKNPNRASCRHASRPDGINRRKSSRNHPSIPQEKLEYESDIGHTNNIGSRLVDSSAHKNNFELWEELLRFRQRHYGDNGTRVIWEGMTARLEGVRLPVTGDRADFFWESFVALGLKQELLLRDVLQYAVELWQNEGCYWPRLYESVVGGLLDRGMIRQALHWHQKLQQSGIANPSDLLLVLRPALWPASPSTEAPILANIPPRPKAGRRQTFKNLCRFTTGHRIYGPTISALVHQGHGEDALSMHGFFVRRQDHPRSFQELQPLLDYAVKYGRRKEFEDLRAYAKKQFPSEASIIDQSTVNEPDPSARNPDLGSLAKTSSKKDELGARLFATRALNFEMVLGSLKLLGVSEIGPRALREMAVKADDSADILAKLKMIRQSGLSIEDCVFTRLIQKLAAQSRGILLSDVLHSDLHPDVFEDASMQESLLISNYMARDWRQYTLSLAILAEHFPDSPGLLDIHFRKHLAAGELNAASKIVDELTLHGKTLSEHSVDVMAEKVLTPRRMRHRPPPGRRSSCEEVMTVFKVLQRVVPAGAYVSAAFWEEMLKRLGMGGFWEELHECCHWLARQYCRSPGWNARPAATLPSEGVPALGRDGRMLELIFTREMQAAIVSWGFLFRVTSETASTHSYLHPATGDKLIPWVRGIVLLRELERVGGLRLRDGEIRKATRHRLQMLFGQYCHSARRMNRMLRRRNPYSLQRVVDDINRAWGALLFEGSGHAYFERLVNPWRSLWSQRRSAKVTLSRKLPR
ncbi:uncharacterized protein N7459_003990 [Penicillium hispanicum]|uniref:uncharacterized protein n=1 Tax=Penicillium hispanicum TaxID=1080232 RepID=UPI00254230D4|nr:uncharacterized protein N7459_003990 [Penicillium hispanicum]KAJ5584190.1 hypothetical protein N7459_003990 [Penicillium hispanicum]